MRNVLNIFVAIAIAILVVACALALEPVRWCVVYARPWWRRPLRLDRVAAGIRAQSWP